MILKLGMEHYVLKLYKVYINDDPEVTLTYFTTMSNLAIFFLYLHQVSVYRAIGPLVKDLFPRNHFANAKFPPWEVGT